MDAKAASALLQRYLEGNASPEEIILVEQWYERLADAGEWHWGEGEKERLEGAMEARLVAKIAVGETAGVRGAADADGAGRVRRMSVVRWVAAAAVLLGAVGGYLLYRGRPEGVASVAVRYRNDVQPGRNAAVLTLAGGKTIVLDDSANGKIGQEGNVAVMNEHGLLSYKGGTGEIYYNTLTTQKGNQYQLVLPDGSKVWLNAASSITYPTVFEGKERKVTISGEAYFEVAKNEQQPFFVQEGDMTVQVLGTDFNVNGYNDEADIRTTLLEGKIKVEKGGSSNVLNPGEQIVVGQHENRMAVVDHADVEGVMAWKNGTFAFDDESIETVMHQVERWYDVQVVYEANIKEHFVADISRNVPLSELLKLLEATDQVHFRIEGKKVFVIP